MGVVPRGSNVQRSTNQQRDFAKNVNLTENMVHDLAAIEHALGVHKRALAALRALSDAVFAGMAITPSAHVEVDETAAAADWLRRNVHLVPTEARPTDPHQHEELARVVAALLVSSFDVIANPREVGVPDSGGCTCPLCLRMVAAPNLRAKKLRSSDQQRADELVADHIGALGGDAGAALTTEDCGALAAREDLRESLALSTWAEHLVRRIAGDADGPALLALWRRFAWTRTGAPKANYAVTSGDVERSRTTILAAIEAHRVP